VLWPNRLATPSDPFLAQARARRGVPEVVEAHPQQPRLREQPLEASRHLGIDVRRSLSSCTRQSIGSSTAVWCMGALERWDLPIMSTLS